MEEKQESLHPRGLSKSRRRMILDAKRDGSEDLWLSTQLGMPQKTVERLRVSLQSADGRHDQEREPHRPVGDVGQLEFIQYEKPADKGRGQHE